MTTNNKVNEHAVNSLKGSTKKWSPIDQGSGITYVVNGSSNTAQFVDGTFTTTNVEYVTIDLLNATGQVISSENVSIHFMQILFVIRTIYPPLVIGGLSRF